MGEYQELSDFLRQQRLAREWSATDVCESARGSVSKPTIYRAEAGVNRPSKRTLQILANVYDTDFHYLLVLAKYLDKSDLEIKFDQLETSYDQVIQQFDSSINDNYQEINLLKEEFKELNKDLANCKQKIYCRLNMLEGSLSNVKLCLALVIAGLLTLFYILGVQ